MELYNSLEHRECLAKPIQPLDLLTRNRSISLYQRDVKGHCGCVNALEFSPDENLLISGGDDCEVFLWNTGELINKENAKPLKIMNGRHYSNIFSVGFSLDGNYGYSAGNDGRFIAHDVLTGKSVFHFNTNRSIHRLCPHPSSVNIVAAAGEDRKLHVFDIRDKEETSYRLKSPIYSAVYNSLHPELMCVVTRADGVTIRDIRNPKEEYASLKSLTKRCTYARWAPDGFGVVAVISKSDLIYFRTLESCSTVLHDDDYLNACTMKSCEFIGNDFVLCGSDKWDIFAWKIPCDPTVEKVDNAYTVLRGHRSVANHIRHSPINNVIVSSGVEKIIKCWSSFELTNSYRDPVRRNMGHISSLADTIYDSPDEDLHTLYQFDSYLRNAINGNSAMSDDMEWDSDTSDDGVDGSELQDMLNVAVIDFNVWSASHDSSSSSSLTSDHSYAHSVHDEGSSDTEVNYNMSSDDDDVEENDAM